ncbi:hypothetical protein GGR52DRAFT_13921 [Hypoxylon sp. FL1284]|nr:hypothetical protein GGR52DRAFT_13921 [Hypoxylon sp. FL1284]
MSASSYVPTFPSDRAVDEKMRDYMANFYAISDDRSKNEEWVDHFLPDAVLVMGDKSAKGTDEIRRLREGMWEQVGSRRHKPEKVFPASFGGADADNGDGAAAEYMLHGTLDLVLKNGEARAVSWAGHAVLTSDAEGKLKYKLYQVYQHKKSI